MKRLLAATAALAFAASAAQAEIKIGSVLSVTGPASFLGDPEKKTLEMYVAELNAAGGVNGEQIKVFIYDDGGDANKARTFATRLVEEDKVDAVVGGSITGTSLSMRDIYEEAKIPFIALAGAAAIVVPVRPYVFKTPHTEPMSCGKIFEDLKKRNLTKIAMISGTDGWGKAMREECLKMAPQFGVSVVKDEIYGATDSDMTPQLTNIKNTPGVQAVINCGFGQGPAIVTRNYRQLGITAPFYQSHGVASKSYINLAGRGRRAVAGRRAARRRQASRQRSAEESRDGIQDEVRKSHQPASLDLRRSHARRPVHTGRGDEAREISRQGQSARRNQRRPKGFIGTGRMVNMSSGSPRLDLPRSHA
jgi:branched-chain amino acid transport system substrate-binding protein